MPTDIENVSSLFHVCFVLIATIPNCNSVGGTLGTLVILLVSVTVAGLVYFLMKEFKINCKLRVKSPSAQPEKGVYIRYNGMVEWNSGMDVYWKGGMLHRTYLLSTDRDSCPPLVTESSITTRYNTVAIIFYMQIVLHQLHCQTVPDKHVHLLHGWCYCSSSHILQT